MPQAPKRLKIKRAQKRVLVKKGHILKGLHETKSYKPLCKKLQLNNLSLAKALSKERRETQLLFSQNIALNAEIHDLGIACSRRDTALSNILRNAKEMLTMFVSMSRCLTNTISACQEFAESVTTNATLNSSKRTEAYRRLSEKSPPKGVVKPMVSGCTITNPTISLSRLHVRGNDSSPTLSIIPEVVTPPRSQDLNDSSSSNTDPLGQRRTENGRACRMPERLVVSQRESDENERRLSSATRSSNRHSSRMSGKMSGRMSGRNSGRMSGRMSGRLSGGISGVHAKAKLSTSSIQRSMEELEHVGSPTVKLNNVSNLLQNSHCINVRMLRENRESRESRASRDYRESREDEENIENEEHGESDNVPEQDLDDAEAEPRSDVIAETLLFDSLRDDTDLENANESSRTLNYDDPLEGPSWLLNDSQNTSSFTSKKKKRDDECQLSNDDDDDEDDDDDDDNARLITVRTTGGCSSSGKEQHALAQPLSRKRVNYTRTYKNVTFDVKTNSDDFSNGHPEHAQSTISLANFITHRRGHFENEEDDDDDFTLMYARQPRNMHFDINDLKLPVLEESALKPAVLMEPEPEITTDLRKISQICPIPSVSRNTLEASTFEQSTVKLPLFMNNDDENRETVFSEKKKKDALPPSKRRKAIGVRKSADFVAATPPDNRRSSQKRGKEKVVRDPGSVKVVLKKLNDVDVKSRTPSPENEMFSRDTTISLSPISSRTENSSDSESNLSMTDCRLGNRPRRKRAPVNFCEPSLKKKLRRNK